MTDTNPTGPEITFGLEHTHTLEIHYYPDALGHGRGIMRVDVVEDGTIVDTHTSGSPAPMDTLKRYAHTHRSRFTHSHPRPWLPNHHAEHPDTPPPAEPFWSNSDGTTATVSIPEGRGGR